MKKALFSALAAGLALAGASSAHAVLFDFTGLGTDTPTNAGNVSTGGTCNGISISAQDLCTVVFEDGFDYAKGLVAFNAVAVNNQGDPGITTALIQDLNPADVSGLGALTTGEGSGDDQVQTVAGESIVFSTLTTELTMTFIDFNNGADNNCTGSTGGEGICGTFKLLVDGIEVFMGEATDDMDLTSLGIADLTGNVFEIIAMDAAIPSGFTIGQVAFTAVPVPGAAVLLLSGIAGLGFASRKKKAAA